MNVLKLAMSGTFLLLAACVSSPPAAVNYYRLGASQTQSATELSIDLPALVIDRIALAEYLSQSGLVIAQGDHQLQVSRTHLWAEGLDRALPRTLLVALEEQSNEFRVYLDTMDYIPRRDYELRLQIDSFQATDAGEVVAAGRYQLIDTKLKTELAARNFFFTEALETDGYPHAVERMRTLVSRLAAAINEDLLLYHSRKSRVLIE